MDDRKNAVVDVEGLNLGAGTESGVRFRSAPPARAPPRHVVSMAGRFRVLLSAHTQPRIVPGIGGSLAVRCSRGPAFHSTAAKHAHRVAHEQDDELMDLT